MGEQDWDDDTGYRTAVRRTRIMTAIALTAALAVIALGALGVLGLWLFTAAVDALAG
ncbi:hypothetical protein [Streptomyces griseus]|uniref:hypothetical protein n=1 Tax=Streptomyces griseus TaxID=1911 RepID=UPI000AA4267F|nr:hypothetical protein [Streptomyces griseus]